ncbi:protein phosphatase 2C domain-containing protein [Bacillus sp. FJAT-42376]|uniref:protein phosphatase 2C domain-containing protein n=1 Tax=Bacillus sp. FJAT-42376 TaxID=2014076 RepID=UPI0013DD9520|nr:protein phosphatase 2C domain-containing protein [Bacillus sp. FJAT-42376]
MLISLLSHKSPKKNEIEDAFFLSSDSRIFGVFDGVTPLDPALFTGGHNGAYLASHLFASSLAEYRNSNKTLEEWLVETNSFLLEQMKSSLVNTEERHLRWATCAAVLEIKGDEAFYVQCGDCMIIMEDISGKITPLTSNSVEGISARAKAERERRRKSGENIREESFFDSSSFEKMKHHRQLANRPIGYSVANGDPELKDFIQSGKIALNRARSLFLLSDGLFHPELSLEEVYKEVSHTGIESYAEALRYKEYTEGLPHDDMTGIFIRLDNEVCLNPN